jgi:hypothetical protein
MKIPVTKLEGSSLNPVRLPITTPPFSEKQTPRQQLDHQVIETMIRELGGPIEAVKTLLDTEKRLHVMLNEFADNEVIVSAEKLSAEYERGRADQLAVIKGLPAMQEEDEFAFGDSEARNELRSQILAELEAGE